MEDREVWRLNLELLPRNPHGKAGNEERRREEEDKRTEYAFNCYSECRLSGVVLYQSVNIAFADSLVLSRCKDANMKLCCYLHSFNKQKNLKGSSNSKNAVYFI